MPTLRTCATGVLMLICGLCASPATWAEDGPAASSSPKAAADEAVVGTIRGTRVNIRVGPRIDGAPLLKMEHGDVVVIVERVPGWYGVWIPQGLPAAVSTRYVTPIGEDQVRVDAENLNLRVMPPGANGPMPAAFRDHPNDKETLTVIRPEGDWVWVIAPERVRAYVHAKYVQELGPISEHPAVLEGARAKRKAWSEDLAKNRLSRRISTAADELRDAIGSVQDQLHSLRLRGGWERTPLVALANTLDAARERHTLAPARLRQLAAALRADLEAEATIRVARRDAEVTRARGLSPDPEKLPAPKVSSLTLRGTLRWESIPRWRNGGAWILWSKDRPTHVVQLTTGMPLPHPDLKAHADGKPRTLKGMQPGERLFGLPVLNLHSLK